MPPVRQSILPMRTGFTPAFSPHSPLQAVRESATINRCGPDGTGIRSINSPRLGKSRIVREHNEYQTLHLPSFELSLARWLAVADAWKRPDECRIG